jgi:hypothetical protein
VFLLETLAFIYQSEAMAMPRKRQTIYHIHSKSLKQNCGFRRFTSIVVDYVTMAQCMRKIGGFQGFHDKFACQKLNLTLESQFGIMAVALVPTPTSLFSPI